MNLFRVRGIQISVHASFLLLFAYVAWEGWNAAAWLGAAWLTGSVLAVFVCVTLHELGHVVAARYFGVRVPRILLLPIGGMAEMESIPRRPREEIIIALAGPAVNYVLIGILMIFVRFPEGWSPFYLELSVAGLGRYLVVANVIMGVFNLLPAFPMDGGRVLRALLAMRMPYVGATQVAAGVGKLVAITGAGFLIYHGVYMGAALFAFIIFAGDRERRAVMRAEQEAEHWLRVRARLAMSAKLKETDATPPALV